MEPQLTTAVCKNTDAPGGKQVPQPFNPFISIDQVQLSIHCHVNSVKSLVCVPGMIPSDISKHIYVSVSFILRRYSLLMMNAMHNFLFCNIVTVIVLCSSSVIRFSDG